MVGKVFISRPGARPFKKIPLHFYLLFKKDKQQKITLSNFYCERIALGIFTSAYPLC